MFVKIIFLWVYRFFFTFIMIYKLSGISTRMLLSKFHQYFQILQSHQHHKTFIQNSELHRLKPTKN